MNSVIPEGSIVHIMLGSTSNCLEAARLATQQAIHELGNARPILAMVLTDVSWEKLFQTTPGREVKALRELLDPSVPVIGGYTFGQIIQVSENNNRKSLELLNQHFEVILFGAKE
jgi:hypothetical protein